MGFVSGCVKFPLALCDDSFATLVGAFGTLHSGCYHSYRLSTEINERRFYCTIPDAITGLDVAALYLPKFLLISALGLR